MNMTILKRVSWGLAAAATLLLAQNTLPGTLKILGGTSGTLTLAAPATGGGTATFFAGSDTVAGKSLALGGTNQSSWTASRCVQVNAGGTALEAAGAACSSGGLSMATPYILDGSTYYFNGIAVTRPNAATWSKINGTGLTDTVGANGNINLQAAANSATTVLRMYQDTAALNSSTFTVTALLYGLKINASVDTTCGVAITDGTKFEVFGIGNNFGAAAPVAGYYATTTSDVSRIFGETVDSPASPALIGVKIALSGGTFTYSYAPDGVNFVTIGTQSATAHFAATTGLTAGIYCAVKTNSTPGRDPLITIASWLEQ